MVYYSVVVKALESLTIVIVFTGGRPHLTAMDPLRAGGLPGRTQPRLLDLVPGLRMSLLPAATDCMVALLVVRCMQPVGAYIVPSHFAVSLARLNSLNLALRGQCCIARKCLSCLVLCPVLCAFGVGSLY